MTSPPRAWHHQGYPPPPPPPGSRRDGAGRSVTLGVVSLALGVVALGISWVPWVNLLGLLLALGGLGVGGFAALRRRGAARGVGIGGAAASALALAVVLVLLAVSAVGFVRDRVEDSRAATPVAPGPRSTPSPAPSDRGPTEVDKGEEMRLGDMVGMVDKLGYSLTWGKGASSDTDPPTSASATYRLVLRKGERAPSFDDGDLVEVSVADGDGNALTQDRSVAVEVATPSVPGSPAYVVVVDISVSDLR